MESRLKSLFKGIGVIFFTIGIGAIIACIFNKTVPPRSDFANKATIYGFDERFHIIGRKLMVSPGNYFTGIKYASAERFEESKILPLKKNLKATKWSAGCYTLFYHKEEAADSDCLTLNIYQCSVPVGPKLWPVLVYIHEGLNHLDSTPNLYSDQVINNLACNGIVVVSINYRQAIFGTMNFVKPNLAIEDVETALKWVNRNIRNFNGNPKNITLMGSRQGAKIASFLSRRKQSRKLFSRLILISGALDDSSIFVSNRQFLRKQMQNIANTTKCIDTESDLDSMTRDQLDKVTECVAKYNKAPLLDFDNAIPDAWDKWPLDPSELVNETVNKPLDIMLGTCEGIQTPKDFRLYNSNIVVPQQEIDLLNIYLNHTLAVLTDFSRTFNKTAFYERYYHKFKNSNLTYAQTLVQIKYDLMEVGPILLEAALQSKNPDSRVFVFNLETNYTRVDYNSEIDYAELPPCLEHLLFRKAPKGQRSLQKFMADAVSNFVIFGDPNKQKREEELKWDQFLPQKKLDGIKLPVYKVLNVNAEGIEVKEKKWIDIARFWFCQQALSHNTTSVYCS